MLSFLRVLTGLRR